MPKPIIKYDPQKLLAKMKEYEAVTGKEVAQQVRNFSRVYALDLMRQVIPFGTKSDSRQSGEKGIWRDLRKAFRVLAANQIAKIHEARAKGGRYIKVEHDSGKAFWLDVQKDILTAGAEMKAHHKGMRKNGRVVKSGDYAITTTQAMRAYEKVALKLVGWAKAGWATAAQKMGADTKAAEKGTGIPAWVKRHLGKSPSEVKDMTADKKNPRVRFDSGVDYMSFVLPRASAYASANIVRSKFAKFLQASIRAELRKVKT
jgi:hypothetical protein